MNIRYVTNQCGLLLMGFGAIMAAIAGLFFAVEGVLDHEVDVVARWALFISAAFEVIVGGAMWLATRRGSKLLGRREALLLVAVSWVVGGVFAAIPFFLWARLSGDELAEHPFHSFVNCYFEAISGLTTTGASVLQDIEAVPHSLLLWRAITQWLGGLGIVVLFVAVLPSLGVGGKRLFMVEAPGPAPTGLSPQIHDTARALWYIYLGLTVAQVVALLAAGMSLFDAICHTCATLATGGFSPRNASIGAYSSPAISIIITVFMVLSGMNFALLYQLKRGRFWLVVRDAELRLYLVLLLLGTLLVFLTIVGRPIAMTDGAVVDASLPVALREAAFTTASLQTTTGFATSDYNSWPFLAHATLVLLVFIGGSAGSTSGGMKVIRVWIAAKVMVTEVERVFRPNVIRPVRLGTTTIDPELKLATLVYLFGVVLIVTLGGVLVMVLEQLVPGSNCDFTTAFTGSLACFCTTGPGLHDVGPISNYGWLSGSSKMVLCLVMILGRLEIFAIIVLFSPRFWRTA